MNEYDFLILLKEIIEDAMSNRDDEALRYLLVAVEKQLRQFVQIEIR